MRHLEKIIIFALMLIVLIYTVLVARNFPKNRQFPTPKQEISAPLPELSSPKEANFFPESVPSPGDESIIEETFTEVP